MPGCLGNVTALKLLDVSRNALTGSLPPELSITGMKLAVWDNNLTSTVPSGYASKLSWIALAYNPALYGAWPSGLQSYGYLAGTGYTNTFTYDVGLGTMLGNNVPTAGTGCLTGTSIGLSQPLFTTLSAAAAALDPSGALLPSWRRGWQPCAPYTSPAQNASTSVAYGQSWAGVGGSCQDGAFVSGAWQRCVISQTQAGVQAITLSGLGLNGTLPAVLSSVASLTYLDVSRNALTGSLPPELNLTGLKLSVFDNNLTGTVPTTYVSKLSWIALAYNPALYGAWPSGLQPYGYTGALPIVQSSYTSTVTAFAYASGVATGVRSPTAGTGCMTGTSLGLDRPMNAILRDAVAALDPSGALLPSWRRGWQPCAPYTGPAQNTSSVMYGQSWAGVGVNCHDGTFSAGAWQSCSSIASYAGAGVQQLLLDGLGLNGTLPLQLRELRTVTTVSLTNNALTGSIPAAWCARRRRAACCARRAEAAACCACLRHRGLPMSWALFPNNTVGFAAMSMLDLNRNALSGSLPPELVNVTSLRQLAVWDNNLTSTVPSAYTSLSWIALAYNPALYGAWPSGLQSYGYLAGMGYNLF